MQRMRDLSRVFLGEKDIEDALKVLEELAEDEGLVAAADTNTVVRKVKPKVDHMYHKSVIDDLRSWLHPPNEQALNHESKRQPDSCKWFFGEEFKEWKAQRNGVYWVYGHAGAGKSILCSSVIDKLKEDPALTLAYFYFDYSDTAKQNCQALASSLVFQLATCSAKCQAYLQEKQSSRSPTYDELLVLLSGLLALSGLTYIVIDALDECPERVRNRTGLWRFFEHLRSFWDQDDIDVRVFVTSRPEIDIKSYLSSLIPRSLNINVAREHAEDIRNYLFTWLFGSESEPFSHWDQNTKWMVYNTLDERSDGM
ncbi:hypothetical protein PENSPDRAFT_695624 [Peniophora sp. CONT]|nr:hypothetical protein PENSPDRAFT_695624 [Peniophora sp. CONT]